MPSWMAWNVRDSRVHNYPPRWRRLIAPPTLSEGRRLARGFVAVRRLPFPVVPGGGCGQDQGSFFRCQIAPWKYSYMLGGMVSLCSLAMCLRTISEYRKPSPHMQQCHWSRAKMYGRH